MTWKSGNKNVITDMGRVIRPSYLEKAEIVTMTATLEYEDEIREKTFSVNVMADEIFKDPQYLSDKEFFDKLNYSLPGMNSVFKHVNKHAYNLAKEELLYYYKRREVTDTTRDPKYLGMCYMMANGFSTLQKSERYYKGEGAACSTEYQKVIIPIQPEGIEDGVTVTYDINAKYNECTGLYIAGNKYFEDSMRPYLEITTKRGLKRYKCIDCALLRSGKYREEILGNLEELYVKTFGPFLGDDTYHSILKFHISGIEADIIAVNLILFTKKDIALSGNKEFYVILFPENMWNGESATWSQFKWQFSNRNGIPDLDTYDIQEEFDFEYSFQRVRFMHFKWIVQAYYETNDERFLYYIIKTMTSFIKMQGHARTYVREAHVGSGWANNEVNQTLCGGWPRGLDAAIRMESFSEVFNDIVKSKYMTPDCFGAIMKYIYDSCDGIAFKSITEPISNLRQFEIVGMFKMALQVPEIKEQQNWIRRTQEVMENMMITVTLEDGTYRETTGGYNFGVFSNFVNFKRQCMESGIILSPAFEERIQKFAVYNALLQGPNGESLQYGDQGAGKILNSAYKELGNWYEDEELRYLLTRGEQGKRPNWTSCHFPKSNAVMLRSDWGKDASYIWIQARGGGSHGHQDDNHITVIADKRVLLTDAGIFTYTADDPFRIWGTSPVAHNTIIINDLSQVYGKEGKTECFTSNDVFDRVTMVSNRYEGFKFERTLTFMKPDYVLVEDVVIPENMEAANDYKQLWHMLPTANISFDENKNMMQSNFEKGANIQVYSLDKNATLQKDVGWYDYGYQQLSENTYGYFMKKNVKGMVRFSTILKISHNKL